MAKLLDDLIENVDGFLQFVFNFVIDCVNRCATGDSADVEDDYVKSIIEKFNIKFVKKVDFIEVCIAILTIISWQVPSNKALQNLYDNFAIVMVKHYTSSNLDILVRFRLCMMFQFTMDFLFETILDTGVKDDAMDQLIGQLITDVASNQKKSVRCLSLVALETLKSTTGDDNLGRRI